MALISVYASDTHCEVSGVRIHRFGESRETDHAQSLLELESRALGAQYRARRLLNTGEYKELSKRKLMRGQPFLFSGLRSQLRLLII